MLFLFLTFLTFSASAQVEELEAIEVIHQGTSNTLVDFVPSVTTLKQKELRKRRENTLGDTLRSEVGVQSSSFGPNASRPIIRGLDGDRIRILQNGLGVLDASSSSVDHAVPVDTLVIDSVEIVRGPMSMLYGSSAVGGVVNVNTTRIHSIFEKGSISEVQAQGDSSQNSLSSGAKIDYGTNKWMFHVDGAYRNANDLRIPGKQKSSHMGPTPGEYTSKNKLPNSESVQKTAALGVSRIFSKGFLGMSYYFFDNLYGTVAEEAVDIKMKQNRVELHGEYKLNHGALKSVRLKTAQSDYKHTEYENGNVGTTFANEGNESRLEFMTQADNFKGISGVQSQMFNFQAVGEEAFLPATRNQLLSIFTLQDLKMDDNVFSLGLRAETSRVEDESSDGKEINNNGYNGSLAFRRQYSKTFSHNVSLSYTERLPNFQELFADGLHVATGTVEIGKENLNKEQAYALDFGVKYDDSDNMLALNLYTQQFKNYITLFNTGIPSSEDPAINDSKYLQVDAVFYGFEVDGKKKLGQTPFNLIAKGDLVRAKNKDNGKNLPRISPPRVTGGLEWAKDRQTYDVEAQYNFEQTKTAINEKRSDSFTLLNAGFLYDLVKASGKLSFFGRAKNILNQEARVHTSTLKEIAPLAGRHFVAGIQYSY